MTAGLHIYGGNLASGAPRSAWDGDTLVEKALDYVRDDRAVDAYNARLAPAVDVALRNNFITAAERD